MSKERPPVSQQELHDAIANESQKFRDAFSWLESSMPPKFFSEVSIDNVMLVVHSLMSFAKQNFFSTITLENAAVAMCLDSTDADVRILDRYRNHGIKNYRAYVSKTPPPFSSCDHNLRISLIHFTEAVETIDTPYDIESKEELRKLVRKRYLELSNEEFDRLISGMNTRFLRALSTERLVLALDMFFRAKTRDHCQYEVRYNEDWEAKNAPSMQIVLAWRNTAKHNFIYTLARCILRHGLDMQKVNATYINPYSRQSILVMSLGLHGANGEAVWEIADIPDFLRELVTLKYFDEDDQIFETFVETKLLSGNSANLLRAMVNFIHQALVHVDPFRYSFDNIEEALCRHPELTVLLPQLFARKFDPDQADLAKYEQEKASVLDQINRLDTGHQVSDERRKNVLKAGFLLCEYTLKTNFYRNNKTALSFRLDPRYLDKLPFKRKEKFPELPYAIYYIRGMHYFGFHIRFKDLARGGLRTVYPQDEERMTAERDNIFSECYNLAYTQQKKNKDIPEGGSKGVIFLKPFSQMESEAQILEHELTTGGIAADEVQRKLSLFREEQRLEYMYQAQRSYIESLITIINSEPDGTLRAKHIVDYWGKPEYVYLGPDENMHNAIIEWIAEFAKKYDYKPGGAFISSKPTAGINHKEYGVTSLGVHVYVKEVLKYLGINPEKENFTVKMSGGPDGDVAGNEILNLYNSFPQTAKLVALTDGSGTINCPGGLDLEILVDLFHKGQAIKHYPPEHLSNDGFLLDRNTKRSITAFSQQTLLYRKQDGKVVEDWISGNEMNALFATNVHQTPADIFVPAGGRPRTLHAANYREFLNKEGTPTSRAIVEGANLYLTQEARRALEELGVLIIKDSSANKGGVICSSFEVLCGLTLGDEGFVEQKDVLVQEILDRLQQAALKEAQLMLKTLAEQGGFLTDISERVSHQINKFTYQILDYLETIDLPTDPKDPLVQHFLQQCLPTLREQHQDKLMREIPDVHKKAMISCKLACDVVYEQGLAWEPSVVDILPLLIRGKMAGRT